MMFKLRIRKRLMWVGWISLLGLLVLGLMGVILFWYRYSQRIYPQVLVGNIEVGGLTKIEAENLIRDKVADYQQKWPLTFRTDNQQVTLEFLESAAIYDVGSSVTAAYGIGRGLSLTSLGQFMGASFQITRTPLQVEISDDWLTTTAASVAAQVDMPLIPTSLEIKTDSGKEMMVEVVQGQNGVSLNQLMWMNELRRSLINLTPPNTVLVLEKLSSEVTEDQIVSAVERANNLLITKLVISINPQDISTQTWELLGEDLVKFIKFDGGYDETLIADYVKGVAEVVNQPARDAKFQFDEVSGRVSEFVPAEDGVEVMEDQTVASMVESLESLGKNEEVETLKISVKTTPPTVGLSEVNRLGIREKLGEGVSTYWHSILSRVHNVELAANRLNGVLIKPGEEFSFNAAVGEVSAATGYQAAYVIRNGRTELGDGGGLCQDSTTVFRAALDAGLPITVRRGHSYRVGYYEQNAKAGLDATVYAPSTDLKFVNDTPANILIQTKVDSPNRTLRVIFYGTSDGRKSSITDHVVWGVTPALPDVFQDDPTLPVGVVKQVDWKAAGAKAKFTYTVERDGQTILEKTFVTNYQPWASVFLRGTKE